MCEVCERRDGSLLQALLPFVRDKVDLHLVSHEEGYQTLSFTLGKKSLTITADGDAASYFHWEPVATKMPPEPRFKRGDRIILRPDGEVPQDHSDLRFNPNSSLGFPLNWPLIVSKVERSDQLWLVTVEGSFKALDERRFARFEA